VTRAALTALGAVMLAGALVLPASAMTDPASVPITSATLPAFPFVPPPAGSPKPFSEDAVTWERVYVLTGERIAPIEGRYYRRLFSAKSAGSTEAAVLQYYGQKIGDLGGVKIATLTKDNDAVLRQGGMEPKRAFEKLRHFTGSSIIEQYLIRSPKGNIWISVGIFDDGLNGSLVVVEEQPFKQTVAPLPSIGGAKPDTRAKPPQ
jgi:OmpA-OmpF porin, OOP family